MVSVLHKEFQYKEKTIPYTLRMSSRARRMRLTIHYDGRVVVTIPRNATERGAERFVREKREWLLRNIQEHERKTPLHSGTLHSLKFHRKEALQFVTEKLRHFNTIYRFSYNQVSVKDHKSQWGSCSTKKNINFNYRIVFLPEHIADYIVVHELCHIKETNHSKNFWNLVREAIPDFEARKSELRQGYLI